MAAIDFSNPVPYVFAILAGVYGAIFLHEVWPWGWSGRRREVKLKRDRKPWE